MNEASQTKQILVIEDEKSIAEICCRVLGKEGFQVDTAANGDIARSMLQKRKKYDVVLIDLRIPGIDGEDLYHLIEEEYPDMTGKVIFTTGDVMAESTTSLLQQTGRRFLPKPFTPSELRDTIIAAME